MSRRRVADSELARLERLAGLHPPPVNALREQDAAKLVTMAANLRAALDIDQPDAAVDEPAADTP